jgi:hypothetical protein
MRDVGCESPNRFEWLLPAGAAAISKTGEPKALIRSLGRLGLFAWLFQTFSAGGVVFFSTGDPLFNTTPPEGALVDSGWQHEGFWGDFLGTAIGPQYFITASHIGGEIGDPFFLNGTAYTTDAFFKDPTSDLIIWRICGRFPAFASAYTNSDEAGKSLVVFGRGRQRGEPVNVASLSGNELKGWLWGGPDRVKRWGENRVESIVDGDTIDTLMPSPGVRVGELLTATFDAGGGTNESHLSQGDSGGGVFIEDGSIWKLAGINYAVDGSYNTSTNGPGFDAALFDQNGLYIGEEGKWKLIPDLPPPKPGAFYVTRISAHIDWINSVLALPTPGLANPVLQSAVMVRGPYVDEISAVVDSNCNTITVPQKAGSQFYRLRALAQTRVTSINVDALNLVLTYEVIE